MATHAARTMMRFIVTSSRSFQDCDDILVSYEQRYGYIDTWPEDVLGSCADAIADRMEGFD